MTSPKAKFPARKISETFLQFAAPVLPEVPSKARELQTRRALEVCFTVWNAVVWADVRNNHRFLDEIRRLTAGEPEVALIMKELIARKRQYFADDERLIGDWKITWTAEGFNLRAEARDPHSSPLDSV